MNRRIAFALMAALLALPLASCIEDENIFHASDDQTERFFLRYVALGNSLTAGYMSGGINEDSQEQAYPALLAGMAGVEFRIPRLAMPGCPPPLLGVLDTTAQGDTILETDRLGPPPPGGCAGRVTPAPAFIQNLAVPGAKIADAVDIDRPGNASNALTTFILGGMSQLEALRRAQPTLVTSWLGNNDALGAALQGDPALLTPIDTFETYHERLSAGIAGTGPLGVALIGVLDVTLAPVLQPGLYFWLADSAGFAPKPVSDDCAPRDTLGVPNPLAMNTVSWQAFSDAAVDTISCDPGAPYVLTGGERFTITEMVQDYNDILNAETVDRDWIFVNATSILEGELEGPDRHNKLRRCEGLTNTLSAANMATLFETRCPHPSAPNFFGSFVTFDGIHMSGEAHQILAEAIAFQLNNKYDLDLDF